MRGDFLIDGQSAYNSFGIFALQGGMAELMSVPSFKNIEITDWLDEDGIEADLSAPVLDKHSMNLSFGFDDMASLPSFFSLLGGDHVHTFSFPDISRTKSLRMTSNGRLASFINAGSLTLSFTEDTVTIPETSPYPLGSTRVTQRGFKLDGTDLSQYGCWVLDGSIQNWRRSPSVKENLVISSRSLAGQTYYAQADGTRYKSRDLSLNILINARNTTEFNACFNSLLYDLTQAGERSLRLGIYSGDNGCFYKSCRCKRLEACKSGTIWCELTLTLTLLSVSPETALGVLAAENGYYVTTEDGRLIQILIL